VLRGDSGNGVFKNRRQRRALSRLKKRGRTNAKFKLGKAW